MKRSVSIAAIFMAMSGGVQAAEYNMACAKPGDSRSIEIISPGQVGQTCDVRYTRDAGTNISIPYHADNSAAFCQQKAAEIVTRLTQSGFECAPVIAPTVATTMRELSAPSQIITTLPEAPAANDAEPVLSEPPLVETNVVEATPAPSELSLRAPVSEDEAPEALEEKINAILDQQIDAIVADEGPQAVRGPAQLAGRALEPIPTRQATSSAPLGRLVGAAPTEPAYPVETAPTGVTPVTQAAMTNTPIVPAPTPALDVDDAPVANDAMPLQAKTQLASTTPVFDVKTRAPHTSRTTEEIILATLKAQSAAWNEGNMDAFMEAYWKSDELKFVSDNVVTQGYSSVQKKYREKYGNSGELGLLQLDKTDFVQVTDDVAIVTGRFNLAKDGDDSTGTFSLVMKRIDGMWRIAHDHSTKDLSTDQ